MKKLPFRYLSLATTCVLTGVMSCLVSGAATLKGFGLTSEFPLLWMKAWAVSWPIAFPTAVFAAPVARRIATLFVEAQPSDIQRTRETSKPTKRV